ncbi:MAG TPA: L-threonylcarbamoyladenylate synthase [Candidatus Paceibacterota bacterium]|nr:L-threonylcarbamoyladenylate synthase [Candidatus Paceibacterota bacterium]
MQKNIWNNKNLIKVLTEGGVAVMPTDTLYGIVGKAEDKNVVEQIYKIRKRNPKKPFIILIGDMSELEKFSISLSDQQKKEILKYWSFNPTLDFQPDPTSIVLDCPDERFSYLHRGIKTLAFRVPFPQALRDLLLKTGPLIAPSANTEKFPASENIEDAKKYFGDKVDLYVDEGSIRSKASKIIKLHKDGTISILRE